MSSFKALLQDYVNRDYEDLVRISRIAAEDLLPELDGAELQISNDALVLGAVLSAVAADGKLSERERSFMKDVLKIDDDSVDDLICKYDSRMADAVDNFVDASVTSVKANMLIIVTAVAAIDERISREETTLIKKLMA